MTRVRVQVEGEGEGWLTDELDGRPMVFLGDSLSIADIVDPGEPGNRQPVFVSKERVRYLDEAQRKLLVDAILGSPYKIGIRG